MEYLRGKTGILTGFQNTPGDATDQSHHFAAFFEFGYQFGARAGNLVGQLREAIEGLLDPLGFNQGDVNLAVVASNMGYYLAQGVLPPDQVGQTIRENICKQP